MRRLILADFRRIVKKINIWVFLIISLLIQLITLIFDATRGILNYGTFLTTICNTDMFALLVGVTLLLAIFGDEFRSKAMITVIGRGFSRLGIVFGKFLDTVFLVIGFYAIYLIFALIMSFVFGVHLSPIEFKTIIVSCVVSAYYMIGNITFAAFVLYITDNSTLSVFIYVVLCAVAPLMVDLIGTQGAQLTGQHFERYTFLGFGRMAFSDFMLGLNLQAVLEMVLGAVLFVGVFLAITAVFFYKKELDF